MANEGRVGEEKRGPARRHRSSADEVQARSCIETVQGPLEVVARCRGDRWAVRATCAGQAGDGFSRELGQALMAALEVCGVDAVEFEG